MSGVDTGAGLEMMLRRMTPGAASQGCPPQCSGTRGGGPGEPSYSSEYFAMKWIRIEK